MEEEFKSEQHNLEQVEQYSSNSKTVDSTKGINYENVSNEDINTTTIEYSKVKKDNFKNRNKFPIIIIVLLLIVLTCFGIWFFALRKIEYKKENQHEEFYGERELKDNNVKKKIDDFLNTIDGSTNYIKYHFIVDNLTSTSNKLYVSIRSILDKKQYTKITKDNLPDKYKNDDHYKHYITNNCLISFSFDKMEKEFNNLFEKKLEFNTQELDVVNSLLCLDKEKIFDEELKIVLYNNCTCNEGNNNSKIYISKNKYTYDKNFYYIYFYVGMETNNEFYKLSNNEKIDVDSFIGNENKFETIKWIFNKDLTFSNSEIVNN